MTDLHHPQREERGGPEIAGGTTTETSLALCSPAAKTNLTEKRERRYYVQAVSHLTDSVMLDITDWCFCDVQYKQIF